MEPGVISLLTCLLHKVSPYLTLSQISGNCQIHIARVKLSVRKQSTRHTFDGAGGDDALCRSSIAPRYDGGLVEVRTRHHHLLQVLQMVRWNRDHERRQGFTT